MKHTKGPWETDFTKDYFKYNCVRKNGVTICLFSDFNPKDQVETQANAQLIAVAPELLEAVKAIHQAFIDGDIVFKKKRISDTDPYHPANTKMTAAIQKMEDSHGKRQKLEKSRLP